MIITKTGDIVKVIFSDNLTSNGKRSENQVTGKYVLCHKDNNGVETNMFGYDRTIKYDKVVTIAGVNVTDNIILFNELEKLL